MKKLLGNRALYVLMPLAAVLYAIGLLGTGYLPIGRQVPGLCAIYAAKDFEAIMHLVCLGFPSVVFGMAAAYEKSEGSGRMLLIAAAAYVTEALILCMVLGWLENPQMLASTPILTVFFLRWAQNSSLTEGRVKAALFRTVSAAMYNVHPLLLAAFSIVLPGLNGLWAFLLCVLCSAAFGWILYRLRRIRFFALFM